ncbi:MAG TPA: hypothetical protein VK766_03560 [Cytophagaceae bacterium]|jgi:hypothetical protein|nr:hypothetical protein [Cytophagaceae bacterium]
MRKDRNFHFPSGIVSPLFMVSMLTFNSCVSSKIIHSEKVERIKNSYCVPNTHYDYSDIPTPVKNVDSLLEKNPVLLSKMSYHDLLMCNAIGITTFLLDFMQLQETATVEHKLIRLDLKQKITDRILAASNEILAISAELDCEGERVEQIASYIDKKNSKRNNRFIVASIIVGSLTTVGSTLADAKSGKIVGISGGLISASLGALAINPEGEKIEFYHPRNLLQPIWFDNDSAGYYPPALWYILNEKKFSNSGQITLIKSMKQRWWQFDFNGKPVPKTETLLFTSGGLYSSENLHIRAALINQLQSTVRSFHQDLSSLTLSLRKIIN